jgi:hypothetical protein
VIMSVEAFRTDVIVFISVSLIGRAGIFVIMSVEAFRTDVVVFISDIITNIPARPIRLTEILAIMFVSTYKFALILYTV